MLYNAEIETGVLVARLGEAELDTLTEHLMNELAAYSPAVGAAEDGHLQVTITFASHSGGAAAREAMNLVGHIFEVYSLHVQPTLEFDRQYGLTTV